MTEQGKNKAIFWLDFTTILLLLVRFVSLFDGVLTDTTEARYAEIGRKMFETGDFITPWADYGVPFWAKAPMSFWATALSFKIFGVSEFAAHLPHFLFMLGVMAVAFMFARRQFGRLAASMCACLLASMPAFLYFAGGVMTDPALTLCAMFAFVGFYNCMTGEGRKWGYLFFAGCGLSLLAKGPIGLVLIGIAIFLYVLFSRRWGDMFRKLPWLGGVPLAVAISVPWYVMAEIKTPGFLDYFIIGEHIKRFLVPGWEGDLYGSAHDQPRGMVWLFYLFLTFPWCAYFALRAFSGKFRAAVRAISGDAAFYVLMWAVSPMLFFTFASNIIPTYAITAMAPSAILMAAALSREAKAGLLKFFIAGAFSFALFAVLAIKPDLIAVSKSSDKQFVLKYIELRAGEGVPLVYMGMKRKFSGEFYSGGKALGGRGTKIDDIKGMLAVHGEAFVIASDELLSGVLEPLSPDVIMSDGDGRVLVRVRR
ncbi:MAG: glycosyltransferase family 39 protein [Rickettsiales bacterium]|jgi:4-amino-4-deoxy-L-arabinose transferase-like glycosyltransferase|nr:glycosyltransferase family 39 protein [Rickettsiales bacterium]